MTSDIVDKNKTALAFGAFFGIFHTVWAIMVAIGAAQAFIDWIFGLHFINPPYTVGAFNLGTALVLIIATSVIGYIFGWVLAVAWNWAHRR